MLIALVCTVYPYDEWEIASDYQIYMHMVAKEDQDWFLIFDFVFQISDFSFGYHVNMTFVKPWECAQYIGFRPHTTIRGLWVKL